MSYPVVWVPIHPSNYYPGRKGQSILAIAHHRMVGSLPGTDVVFAREGAGKSSHFGVGYKNGRVEVHQYVRIDHSAFCHGAIAATPSAWRQWGYDPYATNTGTVAIEHEDGGGLAATNPKRGVVQEPVLQASLWLDGLLLSGDVDAWRTAGIRAASWANAAVVARQLAALVISDRTLIDHHDIADYKKPYCWRPWAGDTVGFPRQRYIDTLSPTENTMPAFSVLDDSPVTLTVVGIGHQVVALDDTTKRASIAAGEQKRGLAKIKLHQPLDAYPGDRQNAWLVQHTIGVSRASFLLAVDVSAAPIPDPTPFAQSDIDAAVAATKAAARVEVVF